VTTTTDPDARKAFIDGLRALARFLVTHQDMPVPAYGTDVLLSGSKTDDPRGFVDAFAAMTGAAVEDKWAETGHYDAARAFGPVNYRAYAISDAAMAEHCAWSSYSGCVRPDDPAASDDPGQLGEAA
jgi:hypothetical protein